MSIPFDWSTEQPILQAQNSIVPNVFSFFYINSYIGIFWCISILIENFYLEKKQRNEKFVRFGIRIGSSYELNKIKFVRKTFESFEHTL